MYIVANFCSPVKLSLKLPVLIEGDRHAVFLKCVEYFRDRWQEGIGTPGRNPLVSGLFEKGCLRKIVYIKVCFSAVPARSCFSPVLDPEY
jgi:hypothetical protein